MTTSTSLNLRALLKTAIARSGMNVPARVVSGLTASAKALFVAGAAHSIPHGVILYVVPGDGDLEQAVVVPQVGQRRRAAHRARDRDRPVRERLLAEGHKQETAALEHGTQAFADKFANEHGIQIQFDEGAVAHLIERAQAERMTMEELCGHLFKDYQFGLNLVQKSTGQRRFVLNRAAVESPDKFLSDLVVQAHYPLAQNEKN